MSAASDNLRDCQRQLDMDGCEVGVSRQAVEEVLAERDALLVALKTLLDEADGFNVSGVYFNEPCMGHKGPALAYAAIDKAEGK